MKTTNAATEDTNELEPSHVHIARRTRHSERPVIEANETAATEASVWMAGGALSGGFVESPPAE